MSSNIKEKKHSNSIFKNGTLSVNLKTIKASRVNRTVVGINRLRPLKCNRDAETGSLAKNDYIEKTLSISEPIQRTQSSM